MKRGDKTASHLGLECCFRVKEQSGTCRARDPFVLFSVRRMTQLRRLQPWQQPELEDGAAACVALTARTVTVLQPGEAILALARLARPPQ